MVTTSAKCVGSIILFHCMVCSRAFLPLGPSKPLQSPPSLPLSSSTSSPRGQTLMLPGISFSKHVRHHNSVVVFAQPGKGVSAPAEQSSYYDVLGISMNTNSVEVKRAYASLAKQYHPDVTGGDPASTEYFYVIRDAYEVLGDEETRKRYNQQLLLSGYRPKAASTGPPKGQELGMSKFEFYIVVILVNIPAFLFLWAPLLGIKFDIVSNIAGAK